MKKTMNATVNNLYMKGLIADCKGKDHVIKYIDRSFLTIDKAYQTDERTCRSVDYLVKNWNPIKCQPLTVVPHYDDGKFYVVDGWGRLVASEMVDKDMYSSMECMIILNAPQEAKERQRFEAELFAFQNKDVSNLTPLQKHGAYIVMGDETAITMDKMKEKYDFSYSSLSGQRSESILGSYAECYKITKSIKEPGIDWIFRTLCNAGWNRKANGYNKHIFKALCDVYKLYPENREIISQFLIDSLRGTDWMHVRSESVHKYPVLYMTTAVSMWVEDIIVEKFGYAHKRKIEGTKVIAA